MAGPLQDVRVIDFGQYIAGPLAALLLHDQGATVVHVDPPGGPRWQHASDAYYNRGKQRITLDLKTSEDLQAAHRLIAGADVVIENFRPGVMRRLGLGAKDMTAANSRLIYCSLPGFASDDPRASVPAWEGVVSAAAAAYLPFKDHWNQSAFNPGDIEDPERPIFNMLPIASNMAGILGATTVVAALIARESTGNGQHIEIPLFDAMLEAVGGFITRGAGGPPGAGGPGRGLRLPGETQPVKDGGYVNSVAYARFIEWLLDDIGMLDAFTAEGLLDIDAVTSDPARNALMQKRYSELMLTRTAEEWDEIAARLKIPFSAIRSSRFWLNNEHARQSKSIVKLDDPELGETWMVGQPLTIDGAPLPVEEPRHTADADRNAVLDSLEAPAQQPSGPARRASIAKPLEGYTVIDLTQVVAGPTAGRILADFGAEVIKVNNPGGTRAEGLQQLNRGKRMLLLDIQVPEGQDVFWRLIDRADVVLDNRPPMPCSATDWGMTPSVPANRAWSTRPSALRRRGTVVRTSRPREPGPVRDGHDGALRWRRPAAHAALPGQRHRYGRFLGVWRPAGPVPAIRTGDGCIVRATLTQTASLHQGPYLLDYKGKVWDEPRGPVATGWGPLQRMYRAVDGWFFLGATPEQRTALASVEGLGGIAGLSDDDLASELERRFEAETRDEWVLRLVRSGLGAHALLNLVDSVNDPVAKDLGSVYFEPRGESRTPMSAPAPRLSSTPIREDLPRVRMPGIDASSILTDLGLGDRLQALIDTKVIRVPSANAGPPSR